MSDVADRLAALCERARRFSTSHDAVVELHHIFMDNDTLDAIVAVLRPTVLTQGGDTGCRECNMPLGDCVDDCTIGALASTIDAAMKETT